MNPFNPTDLYNLYQLSKYLLSFTDVLNIVVKPLAWVSLLILQIASYLAGLAGLVLNYVIYYSVVDMANIIDGIKTIDTAWKVIRDIGNMGFIFILVYAAIKTILGIGSDSKKLIVNIVVVAVLVNFSLFFTKVVIDASNVLAIGLYEMMAPEAIDKTWTQGLAQAIIKPLQIQTLNDVRKIELLQSKDQIIIGILGTVVVLIVAFVLFAMAIMLLIRFAILIFVMILSPLMFLGWVLPGLDTYRKQWTDALLGQAFFAPIFFLLIYVVVVVSNGLLDFTKPIMKDGSMATALLGATSADGTKTTTPPGSVALLVNFFVVIVLLIMSLIVSKKWADKAGPSASGLTKWAMGAAGGASFGLAGRAGRNTVGRAAEKFKDSDMYRRMQTAAPTSRMARLGLAATNKTAAGSFDIRGTGLGKIPGISEAGGPSGVGGFEAKKKQRTADATQRTKAAQYAQNRTAIDRAVATGTPAAIASVRNNIRRLSNEDIVKLPAAHLTNVDLVAHMKSTQADAIHDNDSFTRAQKDAFTVARNAPVLASALGGNVVTTQQGLMRMSAKELNRLGITASATSPGLRNATLLQAYTPSMLRRMATELDPADIATLRADMVGVLPAGNPTLTWLNSPDGQATFS